MYMVVPESFALPPYYLLIPLIAASVGLLAVLVAMDPAITDRTIVAFTPWIMTGATFHVLYRNEVFPSVIEPLFGAPTVYVTTGIITANVWLLGMFLHAGGLQPSVSRFLGTVGTAFFISLVVFMLFASWDQGTIEPLWPLIALIVSGIVASIVWFGLSLWQTDVATATGMTGALVVFAHTVDGISTAIGYDVLGATEEVPLSLLILEFSESLPTADLLGAGWLFVLVKITLAVGIVYLFEEFVREEPRKARLVLLFAIAVGLGPGIHNVLLFTVPTL